MLQAKERKVQKQYDNIPVFINEDIKDTKESRARIAKRLAEEKAENERQEKAGIVTKANRIGRKAYKMRKTDF